MINTLAKELAQAEKKLRYWKKSFASLSENSSHEEVKGLLSTYALLISKAAKQRSDEVELAEALGRIDATERQLEDLFAAIRLMTNKIGSPSVQHVNDAWDK